ncbi:hypothetical protein HDU76_007136, partial [Blyttiomyces sp. JEL0837]
SQLKSGTKYCNKIGSVISASYPDKDSQLLIRVFATQVQDLYERLIQLLPDLSGIPDTLKVYLYDNAKYGYFSTSDGRPIFMLDKDDPIPVFPSNMDGGSVVLDTISKYLIHIPMRHCWMEDLQPSMDINPAKLFILAILCGHYDLAVKMVDELEIVDLGDICGRPDFIWAFEQIGKYGYLNIIQFLHLRTDLNTHNNLSMITSHLVDGAFETGQLAILEYAEKEFGTNDEFRDTILDPFGDYNRLETSLLDCWEWVVDLFIKNGARPTTIPLIKNLKDAERVVDKLGPNSISGEMLSYAARNTNVETFYYLLRYRQEPEVEDSVSFDIDEDMFDIEIEKLRSKSQYDFDSVMFSFFESDTWSQYHMDNVKLYHQHRPTSTHLFDSFYAAVHYGNTEIVEFLLSTGDLVLKDKRLIRAMREEKYNVARMFSAAWRPGVQYFFDVNVCKAVIVGDLDAMKIGNNCRKDVEKAFCIAARKGDFDVVRLLSRYRTVDWNLEKGICEAMQVLGVKEIKDGDIKLEILRGLKVKSINGNMADLVRELFGF